MFRAPDGGSDDEGNVVEVPAAQQAPRLSPAIASCSPFLRRRASSGAASAPLATAHQPSPAQRALGKLYTTDRGLSTSPKVTEKQDAAGVVEPAAAVTPPTDADVGAGQEDTAPSAPPLPSAAGAAACEPAVFERLQAWAAQVCEHQQHQRQAQEGELPQQGHCYQWQQPAAVDGPAASHTAGNPDAPSAPALATASHEVACDLPAAREMKRRRGVSPTPPPLTPPCVSESPHEHPTAAAMETAAAPPPPPPAAAAAASGLAEGTRQEEVVQQQQREEGSNPRGNAPIRSCGKRARQGSSSGATPTSTAAGPQDAQVGDERGSEEGAPPSVSRRRLSHADDGSKPSPQASRGATPAAAGVTAPSPAARPQAKRACEEGQGGSAVSPSPSQRCRVDGAGSPVPPMHAEAPGLASPVGSKRPAAWDESGGMQAVGGSDAAPAKAMRLSAQPDGNTVQAAPEDEGPAGAQPFTDEWWSCLAHAAATDGAAPAPMDVAGGSGGPADDDLAPMELELEAATAAALGSEAAAGGAAAVCEGLHVNAHGAAAGGEGAAVVRAAVREDIGAEELSAAHPLVPSLLHQLRGGGLPAVLSGGLGGPLQALAARQGGWTLLTAFAAAAAEQRAAGQQGGGRAAAAALGLALQLQQEQEVLREQLRKEAEAARQAMQQLQVAEAAAAAAATRCNGLSREASGARARARSLEDQLMCSICFERPRDSVLLPCCHFVACSVCVEQMGGGSSGGGHGSGSSGAGGSNGGATAGGTPGRGEPKRCPVCRGAVQGQVVVHLAAAAAAEAATQAEQEGLAAEAEAEAAGAQQSAGVHEG